MRSKDETVYLFLSMVYALYIDEVIPFLPLFTLFRFGIKFTQICLIWTHRKFLWVGKFFESLNFKVRA